MAGPPIVSTDCSASAAEAASGELRELTEWVAVRTGDPACDHRLALEVLDHNLEKKCVVVSTGSRATNPFRL